MEGLNYHTLALVLHRMKFPDVIAKTLVSSQDKAVKKAASLALISLVYGVLPETKVLVFNLEELKGEIWISFGFSRNGKEEEQTYKKVQIQSNWLDYGLTRIRWCLTT